MAQLPCFVNTEPLQNDLEALLTSFIFNIYFNAALLPVLPLPGCSSSGLGAAGCLQRRSSQSFALH